MTVAIVRVECPRPCLIKSLDGFQCFGHSPLDPTETRTSTETRWWTQVRGSCRGTNNDGSPPETTPDLVDRLVTTSRPTGTGKGWTRKSPGVRVYGRTVCPI